MRRTAPLPLNGRQRAILFAHSNVSIEKAQEMPEHELSYEFLVKYNVRPSSCFEASVFAGELKQLGARTANDLLRLGFGALHLISPRFCLSAIEAFGVDKVVGAFFQTPNDAVHLVGTQAAENLGITALDLLEKCAGQPEEARTILVTLGAPKVPAGITVKSLRDAGLHAGRGAILRKLEYTPDSFVHCSDGKHAHKLFE